MYFSCEQQLMQSISLPRCPSGSTTLAVDCFLHFQLKQNDQQANQGYESNLAVHGAALELGCKGLSHKSVHGDQQSVHSCSYVKFRIIHQLKGERKNSFAHGLWLFNPHLAPNSEQRTLPELAAHLMHNLSKLV